MASASVVKASLNLFFKGVCIGVANIIPGVSGGTLAFILGIYEQLMQAVQSFNMEFVRCLLSFQIKKAFSLVSWKFLGIILAGILTATLSLSRLISWLLAEHPVHINAFFLGLILASGFIIAGHLKKKTWGVWGTIAASTVLSYIFVGLMPLSTPEHWLFIFFSGAVSMCAMILPGISGAFILLLLGKYQFILDAINNRDVFVLAVFMLGTITGVLSFVRVISWLFRRFHDPTMAVLTGLMLGSLRKIWPWKETLRTMVDRHGDIIPVVEQNILPGGWTPEVFFAIIFVGVGLVAALGLDFWGKRKAEDLV